MKFQTLALAAALIFGAATAIAAPNDTAKGSGHRLTTHATQATHATAKSHHTTKRHHAKNHQAMVKRHHGNAHAMRQHRAEHMAGAGRNEVQPTLNSAGREDRMEQALQKFRANHG